MVQGSGFVVQGSVFTSPGSECRVQVAGIRVKGSGLRVSPVRFGSVWSSSVQSGLVRFGLV